MANEDIDKYVIYDRAIEIKGEREIQEFFSDPKGFLKRLGIWKGFQSLMD
jgi:hypothetical protein